MVETKYEESFIKNIVNETVKSFMKDVTESIRDVKESIKEIAENVAKDSKAYTDLKCHTCTAYEIFEKERNVDAFYEMIGDYKKAIKREKNYQWAIGLLSTGLVAMIVKLLGVL